MPSITTPLERVARAIAPDSTSTMREKTEALTQFANSIQDLRLDDARTIFTQLPLAQFYVLFGSIDDSSSNEEQELIRVLCQVVSKLLHPFTYDMIMQDENNKMFLVQGLNHFSPEIRLLSVEQVAKCLASDASIHQVASSDLFIFVLATIAFQDVHVASKAIDVASKIGVKEPAAIFGNNASILGNLMKTSSVVQFRVYDLVIRVAGSSDEAFALAETSNLLGNIVQEVKSNDILLRLNAIEVLREVSITPAGFAFLEKSGVLQALASFLDNDEVENDTDVMLTKSLALKFFGQLGENKEIQFERIEQPYQILAKLKHCLENTTNKEILAVAVAVVGLIGSHSNGLLLLHSNPLLSTFIDNFHTSSGDIKAVYLQSLSKLIGVRGGLEVEQLTQEVYLSLNGRPTTMESLVQTAKQPVDEVRVAAFALIQSIASHPWGQQVMAQSAAFMGYLLDRSTENSQIGQKWKYAIVETLGSGENARDTLGQYYSYITQYVRQGPFYRPTESAVAVESA